MTVALLLLTFSLTALHLALAAEPMHLGRRIAIAVAGIALLPLAFGPVVPISHFVFEATGRSMLWVMQGVAGLLLVALAFRLATRRGNQDDADLRLLFVGVLASQTIWLGSAIWLSDYEQGGPTPGLLDAPIYVLDWFAAVGACVLLALGAWRTGGSGIVFRLLTGCYLLIVATLAIATLNV